MAERWQGEVRVPATLPLVQGQISMAGVVIVNWIPFYTLGDKFALIRRFGSFTHLEQMSLN